MPGWSAIEREHPEFAARVRSLFDAGRHKTIATLRADGSPRISGIECEFVDGELRFGSMTGARKGADLRRDPRFALHGPTFHPVEGKESEWPGEAKIAGRAVAAGPLPGASADPPSEADQPAGAEPAGDQPAGDEPAGDEPAGDEPAGDEPAGDQPAGEQAAGDQPDGEMFVADITEVVITGLNAEATKLVVEYWTATRGLQRIERD